MPSMRGPSTVCDLPFLDPADETNFFEFYKKHTAPVNKILSAQIGMTTRGGINRDDENDLRQDVLFRLHRCNIIGRFDRGKSAFNTYLTNTVRSYVKSWVKDKKINEHHSWQPWPTQKLEVKQKPVRENLKIKVVPYEGSHFNAKIVFEDLNVCGAEILGVETRENGYGTSIATRVQIDGLSTVKSFMVPVLAKLEPCSDKRFNYKITFKGIDVSFKQQGLQIRSSETAGQDKALAIRASLMILPEAKTESFRYERKYYPSMNGVNFSVDGNFEDLYFDSGIEEEYSARELVDILKKRIPENLVPVLENLAEGLSKREIAELFSGPLGRVQEKITRLKAHTIKILKDTRPSF